VARLVADAVDGKSIKDGAPVTDTAALDPLRFTPAA
jgi:hypothetical protein